MVKEDNYLLTKDKLKLYTELWKTEGQPKAGIILVHGVGDYSKRYESIAKYFTENDVAVFLFDLRGHGNSGGKKGHVKKYAFLLKDINIVVRYTSRKLRDVPLFLYGHGIGGNLALNYFINYNKKIKGIIITSPWIRLIQNPSKRKLKFIKLISKIIPYYYVNLNINPEYLHRNKPIIKEFASDPNIFQRVTASFFSEIHKNFEKTQFNRYKINVPVLIMQGKNDRLSSNRQTNEFTLNTSYFTTKIWEDMYHDLHNDPENQRVFEYALNWIRNIVK